MSDPFLELFLLIMCTVAVCIMTLAVVYTIRLAVDIYKKDI